MNSITTPPLTLVPPVGKSPADDTAPDNSAEEWIIMRAAADLIGVPYNDMVIAVHNHNLLESKKQGSNRMLRRAEVLEKAEQIRNLPINRRPNRRIRGRRAGATR
ncbi:hypothetical protein EON83_11245 [bacterium]|nr:MAG: hypothetical protein EON83_11245 [bacterium]